MCLVYVCIVYACVVCVSKGGVCVGWCVRVCVCVCVCGGLVVYLNSILLLCFQGQYIDLTSSPVVIAGQADQNSKLIHAVKKN